MNLTLFLVASVTVNIILLLLVNYISKKRAEIMLGIWKFKEEKKIRNQMNDLADHLAVGSAKDIEEYRKITGIIEGLAWTEREVIDLEDKLLKL